MDTERTNIGKLEHVAITGEAKRAYLDYAMSVIVSRALPDVRDGLKPVHRRILFAMHEMSLGPTAKFSKSAKIVGETMGKYHPHGDGPIYDSLVRLAQEFSMRYPLVKGQGNFGSIDGDPPAAMRYTEAKMDKIALEMLADIDKETVEFRDTFDGTMKEPVFLPARIPNLLLMGSEGIAVGMATKIPPHNLEEVVDATQYLISKTVPHEVVPEPTETKVENEITPAEVKDPKLPGKKQIKLTSDVTIDELLQFVKGPDFPTGGAIFDANEIAQTYRTGRGRILVRGIADVEEIGQGKSAIIITELPYQVNKALLVAKIADLARQKKINGITDLRDESDRRGIRIMIELKRDVAPKRVLNNLFKLTPLQTSFPANIVALVDGVPRTLNLKAILEEYIKHRFDVVTRRSEFELAQAKARLHILDGLKIAVDNIDEVIATIRASQNAEVAKVKLMERFALSEIQSVAILDMQLRKLSALEREKLEEEWREVKARIDYLEDLLANPTKILGVIADELKEIKEKYKDPRRTKVYRGGVGEFSEEDLIQNQPTVITLTKTGYIKRQNVASFKTQARGGKGIRGMTTKEEDTIQSVVYAETHDQILFFTDKGKVYKTKIYEIEEASRVAKGQAIVNVIDIAQDENIASILAYNPKSAEGQKHIFLATKQGTVKKTKITEFDNIRRTGIITITMDPGDELSWVGHTSGKDSILLVTKGGKVIRFEEGQVRPTGRSSKGVRGIKLGKDDGVVAMDIVGPEELEKQLLVITSRGLGKRTKVARIREQNRGGQGIKISNVTAKSGKVAYAHVLDSDEGDVLITSQKGQLVKIPLNTVNLLSREAQGVIVMRFSNTDDSVASATIVEKDESTGVEDVASSEPTPEEETAPTEPSQDKVAPEDSN